MVGSPAGVALLLALAAIGTGVVLAVLLGYLFVVEPAREHEDKMKLLQDIAEKPEKPGGRDLRF